MNKKDILFAVILIPAFTILFFTWMASFVGFCCLIAFACQKLFFGIGAQEASLWVGVSLFESVLMLVSGPIFTLIFEIATTKFRVDRFSLFSVEGPILKITWWQPSSYSQEELLNIKAIGEGYEFPVPPPRVAIENILEIGGYGKFFKHSAKPSELFFHF